MFERLLRAEVERQGVERRSEVAQALARQREFTDVSHLVAREVFEKIPSDSVTLLRYFRAHERDFDLPLRVRLIRIVLPDRPQAERMALRLRDAAQAESLATIARRSGVNYYVELSEQGDSTLFQAALHGGAGAVLGPDRARDGWTVARVVSVLPGRARSFAEARLFVERDWNAREGERLMRALCDRARAEVGVRVNPPALARLVPH
jgi:hypothetical protein